MTIQSSQNDIPPDFYFQIDLSDAHESSGLSFYRVAKETGVAANTVARFGKGIVQIKQINDGIAKLCNFYGVPFHDVVMVCRN